MMATFRSRSFSELLAVFVQSGTWRALAFADIRSKYRRTALGPWWITVSNGLTALAIGTVFGRFIGSEMHNYLPYFVTGMTIWTFISSTLNELCLTLAQSGGLIKASNLPLDFYIMRMVQRNFIIFLHNIIIVPLLWVFLPWTVGWGALLSIFGMFQIYLFAVGASLVIAIVCVRYRDVPPLVATMIQFLFLVSPIIWQPEQLRGGRLVVMLNPMGYLMSAARDPMLSRPVPTETWAVSGCVTLLTLTVAAGLYLRYRNRVAYWV